MGDDGGAARVFCESERDVREEIVRKRGSKKKKSVRVRVRFRFRFFLILISSRAGWVSTRSK